MMNKRELIRLLAERTGLTVARAGDAVDALFDARDGIIPERMRKGEAVRIPGFGRFGRKEREARTGRDPRTGKEIQIAASASPSFKAGRGLRDAVLGETPAPTGPVLRGKRGPRGTSSAGPRREPTVRGRRGG